jgi:solute carrier family 41
MTKYFSTGGLVLMKAVGEFSDYEVFSPIINGIGGNLVSIQASRMSTILHQISVPGILPSNAKVFENPFKSLICGTPYAKSSRILIFIAIPGQILFVYAADYINMSQSTIEIPFLLSYLTMCLIQIISLLLLAHSLIHIMWRFKIDPDSSAIPYLTAFGDVFGSCLLLAAFIFLRAIDREYRPSP